VHIPPSVTRFLALHLEEFVGPAPTDPAPRLPYDDHPILDRPASHHSQIASHVWHSRGNGPLLHQMQQRGLPKGGVDNGRSSSERCGAKGVPGTGQRTR
jgi:hypothetical protein